MNGLCVFCLNAPARTQVYPLSLHDALPISTCKSCAAFSTGPGSPSFKTIVTLESMVKFPSEVFLALGLSCAPITARSEEHTSELQSHVNLVCRLLLEKKNNKEQLRWPDLAQ